MPIELGYFTIPVKDVRRAADFFGALFGWQFDQPVNDSYAHVNNTTLPFGLNKGAPVDLGSFYFRCDDIAAVASKVKSLGGVAGEPLRSPSGLSMKCQDDQGTTFGVWQRAEGY